MLRFYQLNSCDKTNVLQRNDSLFVFALCSYALVDEQVIQINQLNRFIIAN